MELNPADGVFQPIVQLDLCNCCGVCLEVCPGSQVDFSVLRRHLFPEHAQTAGLLGNYHQCFLGNSTIYNSESTPQVASGGVATQLLSLALESRMVDGALVTRMSEKDPLKPEPFIAKTPQAVLSAAGSKYCPCPTNLGLREAITREGKYAVVGLPCHVQAIRKAQLAFPALKEKIPIVIGLFCAHSTSLKGTLVILRKLRLIPSQVRKITYRGQGSPGYLSVETKTGLIRNLPLMASFKAYYPVFDSYFFVPWRCLFCQDHFNSLADVSLGDAWLPGLSKTAVGNSVIVARTQSGTQLIKQCLSAGDLKLRSIDAADVIKSQSGVLSFKSTHWKTRMSMAARMGQQVPSCEVVSTGKSSFGSFTINICRLHSSSLKKGELIEALLDAVPFWLYRVYNFGLSVIAKLP